MDMGAEQPSREQDDGSTPPAKRPAGRTKFRETRHPVYRGVRRRDGRWVCEVRVPGKRGERLWLGTHVAAESAARAHDAAMLALLGRSASTTACLNFADSAWLLAVPSALSFDDLEHVQRAALAAVADFQRKQTKDAAVAVNEVTPSAAEPSSSTNNAGPSATSSQPSADGMLELPAALGSDMFELDMSGEMDLGTYYADLAEGLLLEPPITGTFSDNDGADDVTLWRH